MKPTREHKGEIVDWDEIPASGKKVVKVLLENPDLPIAGESIRLTDFQTERPED